MAIIKPVNSFTKPFADTGAKNVIPDASLIGTIAGAASLTDGFPPLTMTPVAAGGIPPSGKDMNGILNQISQHTAWVNAGGGYQFNSIIAAAGGYPIGAIIYSNDWSAAYRNILAGNTTNFNTTPASIGVSWIPWSGAFLTQTQSLTAFTTSGTAPTYEGAFKPAATALSANLRAQVTVHVENDGAASTLNVNGLGAKNIKQYDSTGMLVDAILFTNQKVDLVYDGTYWVVLDPVAIDKKTFASSLTLNGWKKYPDPNSPSGYFIEQWGAVSTTSNTSDLTLYYPLVFPNEALNLVATCDYTPGSGSIGYVAAGSVYRNRFTIRSSGGYSVRWRVIGH